MIISTAAVVYSVIETAAVLYCSKRKIIKKHRIHRVELKYAKYSNFYGTHALPR
jgi:hypothetical protein